MTSYLVTDEARFLKKKKKKKIGGANLGPTGLNQSLDHYFSLKLHIMLDCNNVLHLVEVKPTKKTWELKFGSKSGPELGFHYFSKV